MFVRCRPRSLFLRLRIHPRAQLWIARAPLILLCVLCCAACAGQLRDAMIPVAIVDGTTQVPILVATTRQRLESDPGQMFGGERGKSTSYAAITISVPPDGAREVGKVQWPASSPGDPRKDFVTVAAQDIGKKDFETAIGAATKSGRRKVLVFVHGFNNRFDEAVYRFAQIVHDSKAQAVPVLFTWPSRGKVALRDYTYDRESANYSRDALEDLLDTLAKHPGVGEINVLAHSMGNWVTIEALRTRSIREANNARRRQPDKLRHAMLVAPDIDVDVFRTQIQRMGPYRPQIALFLSQDDLALDVSKTIWGGVPRIGEIDPTSEPYRSELERDRIVVFDLTSLKKRGDNAHSRAFDDITTVMTMIEQRRDEFGLTAPAKLASQTKRNSAAGSR